MDKEQWFQEANEAIERLKQDPEAWVAYRAEQALYDNCVADGLEGEPFDYNAPCANAEESSKRRAVIRVCRAVFGDSHDPLEDSHVRACPRCKPGMERFLHPERIDVTKSHVAERHLVRLAQGALSHRAVALIGRHLAICAQCAERLEVLKQEQD